MVLNFIYLEKFYSESVNPLYGKPGSLWRRIKGRRPSTKIHSADCEWHGIVRFILMSTELIALSTDVSQSR